jgi:F-type H+-transporting ATPase subunit delta
LGILDEFVEAFRDWLDDVLGIARIEVLSALPVPEEQRARLVATFSGLTGRQVRAEFRQDATVLGGLVVKHGSRLYDGSLQAQLRALDRALAEHA